MADITVTGEVTWIARGVVRATWTGFNATGVGTPLDAPTLPDKTVQVFGTFVSGGGTIIIEGENTATGANWVTLNDPQGDALSFTTGTVAAILENPARIRPRMSAQASTTDLSVVIIAQSMQR